MYKIDRQNIKKGFKFYGIFLGLGLVLSIIICYIFVAPMIKKNSYNSSVIAKNIEVIGKKNNKNVVYYSPRYYFVYNGDEFVCESNLSSTSVDTNKKLVYFDSKNPTDCMTEHDATSEKWVMLILVFLPVGFIIVGVKGFWGIKKTLDKCDYLERNGTLYKNLPYKMESTNMKFNKIPILRIVVDFKLPNGSVTVLKGNPRHDGRTGDEDSTIDVLIDLNNTDNYFVDFNIEEKEKEVLSY